MTKRRIAMHCFMIHHTLGFSSNQYEGGNRVTFVRESGNVTCDVISYRSSMNQIECVTR